MGVWLKKLEGHVPGARRGKVMIFLGLEAPIGRSASPARTKGALSRRNIGSYRTQEKAGDLKVANTNSSNPHDLLWELLAQKIFDVVDFFA